MTHILTGHRAVIHFFHLLLFDLATFAFDIDDAQSAGCNTQLYVLGTSFFS